MHTKRYILTAIALLLVTILCAGLAFAVGQNTKFTYVGATGPDGKPVVTTDGGAFDINLYSHG